MTLTIFTILKPMNDSRHVAMIQRNAVTSWQHLHQTPEILVFGSKPGVRRFCQEVGVTNVPSADHNPAGLELVTSTFGLAWELSKSDLFCYVNGDIILPPSFPQLVEEVAGWHRERFLLTGRRTNTPVRYPLRFDPSDAWWGKVKRHAGRNGSPNSAWGLDYFAHRRHGLPNLPRMTVGRWYWDTALFGLCKVGGVTTIDASNQVLAVHQDHDYSHFPGGLPALSTGDESLENRRWVPPGSKNENGLWSLADADVVL